MLLYRYSRWDGSQEVFSLSEEELFDQLSQHLLSQGDIASGLRVLAQRGVASQKGPGLTGLQGLLQQLRAQRQAILKRYSVGSVLEGFQERLCQVVELERASIAQRLEEARRRAGASGKELEEETQASLLRLLEQMAQRSLAYLETTPPEAAAALRHLQSYEFMSSAAREAFDQLLVSLQRQVLAAYLQDVVRHLQEMTPQGLERVETMVRELNRALAERLRGALEGDPSFLQQYGHLPGAGPPPALDQLLQKLLAWRGRMEALLQSLSAEQRGQLQALFDAVVTSPSLREELARLATYLDRLYPKESRRQAYPFQGQEPLGLSEALDLMERLERMDRLEGQLQRAQQGLGLSEIDEGVMEEALGPAAAREVQQLRSLAEVLEQADYIRRVGVDRYELTPKGMRRIGQRALREIFTYLKRDRAGSHEAALPGSGGERGEETRPFAFGAPFHPHWTRSLMNALARGPGLPVRLHPGDLEVYQTQQALRCSTALLLDLSLSMAMRGNFLAAKKVALALEGLIRTQFPQDVLHIVGFSTYAREVKPAQLATLSWDEFDPYTNIQHGLAVASKLLGRSSGGSKQIILISDGEPTAHMEGNQLFLQYPPSPRTLSATLRAVQQCTHRGILINIFMLAQPPHFSEFVDRMGRLNRGRVFYTNPEQLGRYIVVDYLARRRLPL